MKKAATEEHEIIDFSSLSLSRELTEREKRFIYYYCFPGETFMSQAKAAAKAGYKDARRQGYNLRHKPVISTAIELDLTPSGVHKDKRQIQCKERKRWERKV